MSPIVSTVSALTSLCSSTPFFSVPHCSFLPFWLFPLREVPALHAFSPEMLKQIPLSAVPTSPRVMCVASSTGYSVTVIDLIRILFYMTGSVRLGHRNVYRPHHIWFDRGFCLRCDRSHLWSQFLFIGRCHFHRCFQWSTRIYW